MQNSIIGKLTSLPKNRDSWLSILISKKKNKIFSICLHLETTNSTFLGSEFKLFFGNPNSKPLWDSNLALFRLKASFSNRGSLPFIQNQTQQWGPEFWLRFFVDIFVTVLFRHRSRPTFFCTSDVFWEKYFWTAMYQLFLQSLVV